MAVLRGKAAALRPAVWPFARGEACYKVAELGFEARLYKFGRRHPDHGGRLVSQLLGTMRSPDSSKKNFIGPVLVR